MTFKVWGDGMMLNFSYDSWVQVSSFYLTGECFSDTLTIQRKIFFLLLRHVPSHENKTMSPLLE